MTQKTKLELIALSALLATVLFLIFLIYQGQAVDSRAENLAENLIMDRMDWSQASDYRLESTPLGTEIRHLPTRFRLTLPKNWAVQVIAIGNGKDTVRIDAQLQGSRLDPNNVITEGCSLDLKFAQAPLRWHSTREIVESLQQEVVIDLWKKELIAVGRQHGLKQSHTAQSGRSFIDVLVPTENYYLLDLAAIFTAERKDECWSQLQQALMMAEIN